MLILSVNIFVNDIDLMSNISILIIVEECLN